MKYSIFENKKKMKVKNIFSSIISMDVLHPRNLY